MFSFQKHYAGTVGNSVERIFRRENRQTGFRSKQFVQPGDDPESIRASHILVKVDKDADAKTWAEEIWANLNPDNKVSLFVQYVDLATNERESVIINKHN